MKIKQNINTKNILCCLLVASQVMTNCAKAESNIDSVNAYKVRLKAVLSNTYVIAPGDQLVINDRTLKDTNNGKSESYDLLVDGDGTIIVPIPDGSQREVTVAGLTLDEASEEIRRLYGETLKHPLVFVKLGRRRAVKVFIGGEVTNPGIYKLEDTEDREKGGMWETEQKTYYTAAGVIGFPLLEAIQLVGGLKPRADITKIQVTRGNGVDKLTVNLKDIVTGQSAFSDIYLQSGDTVYVPIAEKLEDQAQKHIDLLGRLAYQEVPVNVIGETPKPGNFVLKNYSTIVDAIGFSGGTNVVGSIKKVKLSRFDDNGVYLTKEINVYDLINKGSNLEELRLKPGDNIEIVASKGKLIRNFFNRNAGQIIQPVLWGTSNAIGNYYVGKALQDDGSNAGN